MKTSKFRRETIFQRKKSWYRGVFLSFLGISLFGCLEEMNTSTKSNTITFTGVPASVSATPRIPATLSGTIESEGGLDSVEIETNDPKGRLFERSKAITGGKVKYDLSTISFEISVDDCIGTYAMVLTAHSGSKSESKEVDIHVTGATNCEAVEPPNPDLLTISSAITMGAQSNTTFGSSLDLDAPEAMFASKAKQNASTIDLIYLNSFATQSDKLGSPSWAKDNVNFMSGWSTYNQTQFHKVTGKSFAQITTLPELEALWKPASATTTSLDVKPGDLVIVLTDKGKYALIEITSQIQGESGQIKIKVAN